MFYAIIQNRQSNLIGGYYDVVLESGTLVFENYQLSSYKFTYYEEGQKGNPECTTTVSMRVTDRGHTTVTIPTI